MTGKKRKIRLCLWCVVR